MSTSALTIRSGQGDYAVEFPGSIEEIVATLRATPKAVVVADRKVAELYEEQLGPLFEALPTLLLDATEEEKSFVGVEKLSLWMQQQNCTKQSKLIVIGGGIVQDIACFAAHVYYRGIAWIFVPTTLLSMCDSCIGAKCAINLGAFKNQLGAFHAPARVLLCTKFIDTLTDHDVASGYGEILKLALTGSAGHFERLGAVVAKDGLRTPELGRLLRESLEVKKAIIEVDEYELDLRRILNFGHTFGHALESITSHEVPHGLAVAWGCDLVNYLAMKRGMLAEGTFRAVHDFVHRHLAFHPKSPIDATALIAKSRRDKKVADGQVNLILMRAPGSLQIVKTPFDEALEAEIRAYITEHNVFDAA